MEMFRLFMRKNLDRITPQKTERWLAFIIFLIIFMYRILRNGSHFAICYGLWIYLLNGFILFLSPFQDLDENDELPRTQEDEFKPFVRKLPEMEYWTGSFVAVSVSNLLVFTDIFDIPVFWPILLVYYLLISFVMLKTQLQHMIRYKYVPFDIGKKKYKEGEIRL
eukprot:GHVP01017513.1.p1 GENE.GHVP01017513.1~~GHVP01017513.1.p1  ORF type:complete len:165 (+),score=14.86 GHVP01017513.1:92-586(+)